MTLNVGPTTIHPDYHLSLTDVSANELGLILANRQGNVDENGISVAGTPRAAIRVSQGVGGYDNYELPYTPIEQVNWAGGRGNEDFESDKSKFHDCYRVDTIMGDIILGPSENITYSDPMSNTILFAGQADSDIAGGQSEYYFSDLTPSANFIVRSITAFCDTIAEGMVVVQIRSDNAGKPSTTVLAWGLLRTFHQGTRTQFQIPITAYTLVSGTKYWIGVYADYDPGHTADSSIAIQSYYPGHSIWRWDGYTITLYANDKAIPCRVNTFGVGKVHYFEYKGMLYAVTQPGDDTAPKLFCNGWRGIAKAAPKGTVGYNDLNMSACTGGYGNNNQVIKITAGTGKMEAQPWRYILAGYNTNCDVIPDWNIALDTTTEFVILGFNVWVEITGHGLTKPVTDVCVSEDVVYFAQGDTTYIRRMNGYNNAGTWTYRYDVDGTSIATYLALITDSTGAKKVWAGGKYTSLVYSANAKKWSDYSAGAGLAWATGIQCGSSEYSITNIIAYGNPTIPYIEKEDMVGSISNGIYAPLPLNELKTMRAYTNGQAAMQWGVFLFFNLRDGLERYYDQHLDDIGPNLGEGLPFTRSGNITAVLGYAGRFYAAVDGTYPSIFAYNNQGWHEIFRSDVPGHITEMYLQIIEGLVDRLWFNLDETYHYLTIKLIPRLIDTTALSGWYTHPTYTFSPTGYLITSWIYTQYRDIKKYFKSVRVFSENLAPGSGNNSITVQYQTDAEEETTWHSATATVNISPEQEVNLSNLYDVQGYRIRLKFNLICGDVNLHITPRIKQIVLNSVTRLPVKQGWSVTYIIRDNAVDLNGKPISKSAYDYYTQLLNWSNSEVEPCPLVMKANNTIFDNKRVFIEPQSVTPLETVYQEETRSMTAIGSFVIQEA